VVAPIAIHTQPWLQHVSFNYNLDQIALAVFHLGDDLKIAQDNIPIFGDMLRGVHPETISALQAPALWGAVGWSVAMLLAAIVVIYRKVKPE
jgi:hypothetical protein